MNVEPLMVGNALKFPGTFIEMYTTGDIVESQMALIMALLLDHEGIKYTHIKGVKELMVLVNGAANPNDGVALRVVHDGELLRNVYDLVEWIDKNAMRRL